MYTFDTDTHKYTITIKKIISIISIVSFAKFFVYLIFCPYLVSSRSKKKTNKNKNPKTLLALPLPNMLTCLQAPSLKKWERTVLKIKDDGSQSERTHDIRKCLETFQRLMWNYDLVCPYEISDQSESIYGVKVTGKQFNKIKHR